MGLTSDLVALVAAAAGDNSAAARRRADDLVEATAGNSADTARVLACSAFVRYLDLRFSEALVIAERALALATASGDREARLYALGVRLIVSAGIPSAIGDELPDYFAAAWSLRSTLRSLDVESEMLAAHFLAEGALATGRISEAQAVLELLGDIRSRRASESAEAVPYPPFMLLQRGRVALFAGLMGEAMVHAHAAIDAATTSGNVRCAALGRALVALIAANLDDRSLARRSAMASVQSFPAPDGLIETGVWIIAAFSYVALGEQERAAECVLVAGLDPELRGLQVIDRAMGYGILVTAALQRGDVDAASEWGEKCLPLAAHPAATLLVDELIARLDEARGNSASAAERAGVVAARARLTGRYLDAARADLLRARAAAASGLPDQAVAQLIDAAAEAERAGIPGLRRSVAHELKLLGTRLAPAAGGGWASLSERERQIAVLASDGFSNRVIGSVLFLSGRTVQSYMSRILSALGVASRAALPRFVADHRLGNPLDDLPPLTARQWEVAGLVSEGRSNQEIASTLGISVKTAEKHIGEIMHRWSVQSRTSIARLVIAETRRSVE